MRSHIPLIFPSTRKALWCHTSLGGPVKLTFPRISLLVTEQVLFLAYGQSRSGKVEQCCLCGDVNIEPDCSEVVIFLDQFESTGSNNDASFRGAFRVPTKLIRNSRHETNSKLEASVLEDAYISLADRACSSNKVVISEFFSASAQCTVFGGTNQIHCDLDLDVTLPGSVFDVTPIEAVSIAMTALSKSVLENDKHGIISSQRKSGYLTMDQYRKVVFLLESDPKVLTVPIVGIWIIGVDLVTDPYIWANCVRYMHTTQIRDRVAKPSEPFLLIHKSPLMSCAQCFDCVPSSTALTYRLLSGTHGFSMAKEVNGKRKGQLSVKLEPQNPSTLRGRQFAELMERTAVKYDKENRHETCATPKVSKHLNSQEKMDEDSLPWSSPFPHNFKGPTVTPTVPEVSLLDESNPWEAPKPERLALHEMNNARLNCSPRTTRDNPYSPFTLYREEGTVRKISFDDVAAEPTQPRFDRPNKTTSRDQPARSTAPSLRSPQPTNSQPAARRQTHHSNTLTTTEALHRSFSQDPGSPSIAKLTPFSKQSASALNSSRSEREELHPQRVSQSPHSAIVDQWFYPKASANACYPPPLAYPQGFQQPLAAVVPRPQFVIQGQHTCTCQAQRLPEREFYRSSGPATAPTHPLSVITDNVQRLLSPRAPTGAPPTPPTKAHFQHVDVSPIETNGQASNTLPSYTPSPLCVQTQSLPVSPEVQQILREQDTQLKALQHQIQKLLQAHENRTSTTQRSTVTRTVSMKCATVNTGVSLLECKSFNQEAHSQSTSDTHDSANDSSRSHSLIQHDLTTLDLPTQVTARSFSSDINVDYESYDDSPTGSPNRQGSNNSPSEDSWQSPVLGESVSMMGESTDQQESTKQQLDVIIRNVRDLLAKHVPSESELEIQSPESTNDMRGASASPCPDEPPSPQNSSFGYIKPNDLTEQGEMPQQLKAPMRAHDTVAIATTAQLRKMGIEVESLKTPNRNANGDMLPRLQYISMMMSDSFTSESNKSLELNALALKYLQDDQLTELAQLTVHKNVKNKRSNEASLLRQVLTMPTAGHSSPFQSAVGENNMSIATQQYLRRYALTDDVSMSSDITGYRDTPSFDIPDSGEVNTLKSILRKGTECETKESPSTNSASKGDDLSMQVLDIARLKELPKFL